MKKKEEISISNSKNIKVILVPSYMSDEELVEWNIFPSATVEAEYGEKVIRGKLATLAHHTEEYKNNPAPCNTPKVPILPDNSTILVSHIDLDTLGGIAALMGRKKPDDEFWKAVEFIDLNGYHNLFQVDERVKAMYNAFYAYQAQHRQPRCKEITEITDDVLEKLSIIDKIIDGDKTLIEDGDKWEKETKSKIEGCLVFENSNVRVFNSPEGIFCSAAYFSENQGKVVPSTVTLNGKFKSITVAMADGGKEVSAKELVQELWGDEAGGHLGIAGSPRGREMTEREMEKLAKLVNERYNKVHGIEEKIDFGGEVPLLKD